MIQGVLNQTIKKTALYNAHADLGAKLIPFNGFFMPVAYPGGIQSEYFAVRNVVGIFDISHMGEFFINGNSAEAFLQKITINNVGKMKVGDAQYSAMCYPDGGIVDDLIIYRKPDGYFMVVNAANINKDFDWLNKNIIKDVNVVNLSETYSLIAIQGPESRDILSKFTDVELDMPFYSYQDCVVEGFSVMVSRTGYTGELGFEIYGNADQLLHIWDTLISSGVKPVGLAARDILRMEMKYCLYGNDIDKSTNPIEAGLSWITDFSKGSFVGKDSLLRIKENGTKRQLTAFMMEERGIPRQGYEVFINSQKIGYVTSGTQSPKLKKGIGLAYIDSLYHKSGNKIAISIRGQLVPARIISPPFIKDTSLYH